MVVIESMLFKSMLKDPMLKLPGLLLDNEYVEGPLVTDSSKTMSALHNCLREQLHPQLFAK